MQTNIYPTPSLQTGCAQPYLALRLPPGFVPVQGTCAAVSKVTSWLALQNIKVAGPLFYRYHRLGAAANEVAIEVGFPISRPLQPTGNWVSGFIPQGTFATIIHCGQLQNKVLTVKALQSWLQQQGLKTQNGNPEGCQTIQDYFEFHLSHAAGQTGGAGYRIAIAVLLKE